MANRVAVLGSLNVDTTYRVARFPEPGETISAVSRSSAPGGKGANQAVAAARSGAKTYFIGSVGNDDEGKLMRECLEDERIFTAHLTTNMDHGTGTALVTLNEEGQNNIMVYGGANQAMTTQVLDGTDQVFEDISFMIAQFETPQNVTLEAFKRAKAHQVVTVLNPAPASQLIPELSQYVDVIAPNETEAELLTGIKLTDETSMDQMAKYFQAMSIPVVLITLGKRGVYYATETQQGIVPAFTVTAVDPTAAGDTFIGALVSQLSTNLDNLDQAITYAQRASSLTVQKYGAMPSIPMGFEVEEALKK